MAEYRFRIADSWTPQTLPMERLAEYMLQLARFLGERERVHFDSVEPGSVGLRAHVEAPAERRVADRMRKVLDGEAPEDARKAFKELDDFLSKDNATGSLSGPENVVIPFPGRDRREPLFFGPFRQEAVLYGELIKIGGKDATVSVQLRDGGRIHTGLECDQAQARRLATHLFGPTLRVRGIGSFVRGGDGTWELRRFKIEGFDVLDDLTIGEAVQRLRALPGTRWGEAEDPVRELLEGRGSDAH